MNKTVLEGKWIDLKGEILNTWGKITDNDLTETKGNLVSIAGLIEQKYGHAKEEITTALNGLVEKLSAKAEEAKQNLSDKVEDTKQKVTSEAADQTEDVKLDLRK